MKINLKEFIERMKINLKEFILKKTFGVNPKTNHWRICEVLWSGSKHSKHPMVCDACPKEIYKMCQQLRKSFKENNYFIVKI
ncbi:hypothetical protein DRP04_08160 [Archaeoglobales archaeon]|nr:MAG: hypothetical protein DRP04_08160 [Archaeoglobales archaeon]